ncbi:hypothetical protein N7509_001756 [Penicillium cosmopolitanum]|uniref:Uncharacterized protein n=1 Tax=Penicillium cosmopolitanum TaxID=1131564 RepID=A0A9W9W7T9_9EURO|nr:uncharacterized protein N7509_001756 [Penicillium cosmopolitanum]KAJ5407873.1 hypothetical protein N7509_001756 [Penicillium cosmopolitanum]
MHLAIPPSPKQRNTKSFQRVEYSGKSTQKTKNQNIALQSELSGTSPIWSLKPLSFLKSVASKHNSRKQAT